MVTESSFTSRQRNFRPRPELNQNYESSFESFQINELKIRQKRPKRLILKVLPKPICLVIPINGWCIVGSEWHRTRTQVLDCVTVGRPNLSHALGVACRRLWISRRNVRAPQCVLVARPGDQLLPIQALIQVLSMQMLMQMLKQQNHLIKVQPYENLNCIEKVGIG